MSPYQPPRRNWFRKFVDAFTGTAAGMRGEASFHVHLPAAIAVAALAIGLRVTVAEGCLLALCVGAVLVAELFNSALERLANAITCEHNEDVRIALNIASGAVLVAASFAAGIGLMVFVPRLLAWFAHQ